MSSTRTTQQSRLWAHVTANVLSARLGPALSGHEYYVEPTNGTHVRVTVIGVHDHARGSVIDAVRAEINRLSSTRSERRFLVDVCDENGAWVVSELVGGVVSAVA